VPSYRVLERNEQGKEVLVGGVIWGQDEINVVEDLIAGWRPEGQNDVAEPRKVWYGSIPDLKL